ncbi:MAG: 3-deoxy-manno-octulosonate cytidylyltransferase [Chitinophagales bacterium]|nr:3-deoxy-manno-octulosonate cytidylyltransferase [Chitinophagales bacterium]
MKVLGIIPARYGSSRLEGKPLLDIGGKSMIRRVYERASQAQGLTKLIVATDHQNIYDECKKFSIPVMMTATSHINGTERCGEVISKLKESYDIIVNIQGDEPFIHSASIDELIMVFQKNNSASIGTLVIKMETIANDVKSYFFNPSIIKVVTDDKNKALYFSRSPIPFIRDKETMNKNEKFSFKKHIGMYGFRREVLEKIIHLKESYLESQEKLEQLRWLENGYAIYIAETEYESKSIDTQEDYEYVLNNLYHYIDE